MLKLVLAPIIVNTNAVGNKTDNILKFTLPFL